MNSVTTDDKVKETNLLEAIKYLDSAGIEAGVFGGTNRQSSRKRPGNKRPAKGTPIALYAAIQHEGNKSGTIKPRRFISNSVDKHSSKYNTAIEDGLDEVMNGRTTMKAVLTRIAKLQMVGDIQEEITALHVIDTGALRMAIQAKVKDKIGM